MNRCTVAVGIALAGASPALAQVPTADVAREAKETQTAGCMMRAATSRAGTLQPSQGVKGSMVAPGAGAGAATPSAGVGGAGVMGLAGPGAPGMSNTGFGSFSGSTVSGIDFGALTGSADGGAAPPMGPLGRSSVATIGQVVNGLSALSSALQANGPSLSSAAAAIGTLGAAQAAWNQNTGARIGGASVWGQAIQIGALALQLRNLALLQQTARASGQAQVMRYDATAAVLVKDAPSAPDNSTTSAAIAPTSSDLAPLWLGVTMPQASVALPIDSAPQTSP